MVTHYDANDPHNINMDDVLDPGDTDKNGNKYDLSVEYEQAQYEAFLENQGAVLEATIKLVGSL